MVALSLRSIAHALEGDVVGRQVLAPGPNHSRRDRSLSVTLAHSAALGIVVRSFSGDDWRACRDYVCDRLGIDTRERRSTTSPLDRMIARERQRLAAVEQEQRDAQRTAKALAIWEAAGDPRGTPAETYLASRGVPLPHEAAGSVVRFHPTCPFAGQRVPALVALARDMETDAPKAIHRTALDANGQAVTVNGDKRLSFGPIGGTAIKITPHDCIGAELGVGEGLETALSLRHVVGPQLAVWSLLNAGNLMRLPLLTGVRKLVVAVDHDAAGIAASQAISDRWTDAGREAARVMPDEPGTDLNDLYRRANNG